RALGLDRRIELVLDRAVEIEALVRAPPEVEERVAARSHRLCAPRLEQHVGKRADFAGHDAEQVGLERQTIGERELAARIQEPLERAAPGLAAPARAVVLGALRRIRREPQRVAT